LLESTGNARTSLQEISEREEDDDDGLLKNGKKEHRLINSSFFHSWSPEKRENKKIKTHHLSDVNTSLFETPRPISQ
jgi:hypothetical protein